MRGFLQCIRKNRADAFGGVFGATLYTPFSSAWYKFEESLPEAKINMYPAMTRPKELARLRLRAHLRALGESIPMSRQP